MAVKVLITRKFKEGKSMEVFALLNKMRAAAMEQPGYITGETLIGYDDPRILVVISTWQSAENWINWREDPIRTANEAKLDPYLEQSVNYQLFVLGTYPTRK